MFTGLIQDIGTIRSVKKHQNGDARYDIDTNLNLGEVDVGASICCSGVCLTVVEKNEGSFSVDVSNETLAKSNLGAWRVMTRINIEPSLKIGNEIGGHFVSGHVDSTAEIIDIEPQGESFRLTIEIPNGYDRFIAQKGSIVLDGISLTVNDVLNGSFQVNIIPHTWERTTLSDRSVSDAVNLEVDMLARYVVNALNHIDNKW